ncbi:hypothetical protein [Butyrivibrio sp. INlla14]|uniref:hypothetical protein n=1 Tax=Butyrivibrio sp. INlla14 TaxID=1520808 RepID=UPI0008764A95|nr:hypothetical protein [Butyrivibrio sp. INlla14]SCY47362.1 hypothetical protein SAMN02910371_02442 [Butyrivibrio sp. INlla14]
MSLVISNELSNLIALLEENEVLKKDVDGYKTEIVEIKNSLVKFSGRTANKYRENCKNFTTGDTGKIPLFLDKIESYNTIMEELANGTSKLIDRCHYFGQTLSDDSHKTDYSEGLETGHHVLYDDCVDAIKTACDKCVEYDADELEHVKKAASYLSGETFPDGYTNPIEGIEITMSQYIAEQDKIENFRFSFNAYALYSNALSTYVKGQFDKITDSEYQKTPKPSGIGDTDSIKEELMNNYEDVKLYSAYLTGEEGLAKLQEDCDNYDSLSGEEKKKAEKAFALMFGCCSERTEGEFDQEKAQFYLDGMGIVLAWTLPNEVEKTLHADTNKVDALLGNIPEENEQARSMLTEFGNKTWDLKDNGTVSGVTVSFDKAGINIDVEVTGKFLGVDTTQKNYDLFYTSQERSLDYIDYMQSNNPNYAEHLMNDLGFTKEQLAEVLTMAENHYDMEQLDNLVNANDDYSNVFTTDASKLSNNGGGFALAVFSNQLLADNDGTPANEEEFIKFSNAILNASYDSYGMASTEELLNKISVGAGLYNDAMIAAYITDSGNPKVESNLKMSNGLYAYWAYLGAKYEGDISDALCIYSSNDSNISLSINPYADFYDENTGEFRFQILGEIVGEHLSSDCEHQTFSWGAVNNSLNYAVVGNFLGDEAQEKAVENYRANLIRSVKEAERDLAINGAIDLISVFCPDAGDALTLAKDASESEIWKSIKDGKGLSLDALEKIIDDPFVLAELEANGCDEDTLSRLMSQGKVVLSLGSVVGDYVTGVESLHKELSDDVKDANTFLSMDILYSYNNGTGDVKLCDPNAIDVMNAWNEQGCMYIVEDEDTYNEYCNNVFVEDSNHEKLTNEAVAQVALMYGIEIKDEIPEKWDDYAYNQAMKSITKETGYTEEQIVSAYKVILDGGSTDNTIPKDYDPELKEPYTNIRTIPVDLYTACVNSVNNLAMEDSSCDETFTKQIKDKLEEEKANDNITEDEEQEG